ncbi:MAG: LamG domain-containing protein [Emcibacter sp.]|nr:LamG domain-containing protein [Emcibacter sp.]
MAFPTGWGRKQPIIIDYTKVNGTANLTNYPFLVTLDYLNSEIVDGGANSALNGGGDIRFSSDAAGTNQLPCEVVSFVTSATPASRICEIHVKVPSVSYMANTTIYVWYKKAGEVQPLATDPYGRNAVWSAQKVVYHLNDDPSVTAPQIIDSSGNVDGTTTGSMVLGDLQTGQINQALHLDGIDDGVNIPNPLPVSYTTRRISFWIKPDVLKRTVFLDKNGTQELRIGLWDATGSLRVYSGGSSTRWISSSGVISAGIWQKIDVDYDSARGGYFKVLVNGVLITPASNNALAMVSSTGELAIGYETASYSWSYYTGLIDNLVVDMNSYTDGWYITEYNNQSAPATFATAGTSVAASGSVLAISPINHTVTSDGSALSQLHGITIHKSSHNLTNDNISLNLGLSLNILTALHLLASDILTPIQLHALLTMNAAHGLSNDNIGLYDPLSYSPHPARRHQAQKARRVLSSATRTRKIQPSNNRTLRI